MNNIIYPRFAILMATFNGEKWIFDGYDEQGSGKGFGVTTHTGDKVKFRAWGTGFAEVISNTVLSTNTWYNVTCVATQSEAKVYINGSSQGIYAIEEGYTEQLTERNNLRYGPIFSLNEELSTDPTQVMQLPIPLSEINSNDLID